ncbi:MAG TPA: response regulator [Firmicutes bacterium]|nr:response regulator [Bacillota bacterium]
MYQVLLADDETSVTDSLRRSVDWAGMDLEVAAVVQSGEEAMAVMEDMPIDIVITDIRMANTDGLSLCQKISKMERNIQTIIISGFAEFSYAQRAISYGAVGYCLKPLEYDEIRRVLLRAVHQLKKAASPPDCDDLLDALQNADESELLSALATFGLTADAYFAAVSAGREVLPPLPKGKGVSLRLGYKQAAYISVRPFSDASIRAFMEKEQEGGFSYTRTPCPVSALPRMVKDLHNSAFQFFIRPEQQIVTERTEDRSAPVLRKIANAAALGDSRKIGELLDSLHGPAGQGFTLHSAWRLYNIVSSCSAFSAEGFEDVYSPEQLVFQFHRFSALLDALRAGILPDGPPQDQDGLSNSRFLQMMRYIDSHYDQGLTLNQLAEEMNLNANYLSQVFKKETGKTFLKYITDLRIEKAKKLLDSKNYSISEVASRLGFSDYFYFLKTFKRVTGLTPKQYKQGYPPPGSGMPDAAG